MLKDFKAKYRKNRLQFILTDFDGVVQETDESLVMVVKGHSILDVHPFFITLPSIMTSVEEHIMFHCVQLGNDTNELTTDIAVYKKSNAFIIVIHDLTEHYKSYQLMAQSRNESIIDSELIVLKNNELQERERFKNEFIQNFSHELRNPLTNIIALTNILNRTDLTEEQIRILTILKESTANLKLLLEDVLSISMIAKGKLILNPSVFKFEQFIQFLQFTYETRAKEKGLLFKTVIDKKIPNHLEGDRLRILQILTNLCDNAVKYTHEGEITLDVSLNQKRANITNLRFSIKDTGVGIDTKDLDTIFESFEQLGRTEGAGLGLAIVKGLLDLMGSEIKIDSTAGKGSCFYFDINLTFPINPPAAPFIKKNSTSRGIASKSIKSKKRKVLIVEDDEQIQASLFKILIDTENFYIDVVGDGALVMEEIVNNKYDLILMDINLPNITGDQLTKVIRGFPFKNTKNIPIIGLTAYSYQEHIKQYLKDGMNAVISKPFDEEELLQTIAKFLT